MKSLLKLLIIFLLLASFCQAKSFDILVLPADLYITKENYYGFDEVSEIVANDIINKFQASDGKINTPSLYDIRAKLTTNKQLKQTVQTALSKYKTTNNIDYDIFKTIGEGFESNYILLINSSALTNKNSLKRSIWEVLELSTDFDISYPYRLETSIVLLDSSNALVVWSNNFSYKLGDNENSFKAKNYAQADAEYEKIKLYSKTVVAPSASQNLILRLFPKSVHPIETDTTEPSGGALRFERTLPQQHNIRPRDNFYGDDVFGI